MNVQEANVEPPWQRYGATGTQRPTLNVEYRPSLVFMLLILLIVAIDKT